MYLAFIVIGIFLLNQTNFRIAFCLPGGRRMSERDMTRIGADQKMPLPNAGPQLLNSKSVPSLHHIGKRKKTREISRKLW